MLEEEEELVRNFMTTTDASCDGLVSITPVPWWGRRRYLRSTSLLLICFHDVFSFVLSLAGAVRPIILKLHILDTILVLCLLRCHRKLGLVSIQSNVTTIVLDFVLDVCVCVCVLEKRGEEGHF